MRLFVALDLPGQVKDYAAGIIRELRPCGADVKWVAPGSMHVTLQFLGEVDPELAPGLTRALAAALADRPPLELGVANCGSFPPRGKPQVVWLGLDGQVDRLADLAAAVQAATGPLGFEPETRPFRAHLTLGRLRRPRRGAKAAPTQGLVAAIQALAAARGPDFTAHGVSLMRSTLTPKGPIYEPVQVFELTHSS